MQKTSNVTYMIWVSKKKVTIESITKKPYLEEKENGKEVNEHKFILTQTTGYIQKCNKVEKYEII